VVRHPIGTSGSALNLRYNFSSNVSGRCNCGIGLRGTIGAVAFWGVNGGSEAAAPPGSNAELVLLLSFDSHDADD